MFTKVVIFVYHQTTEVSTTGSYVAFNVSIFAGKRHDHLHFRELSQITFGGPSASTRVPCHLLLSYLTSTRSKVVFLSDNVRNEGHLVITATSNTGLRDGRHPRQGKRRALWTNLALKLRQSATPQRWFRRFPSILAAWAWSS